MWPLAFSWFSTLYLSFSDGEFLLGLFSISPAKVGRGLGILSGKWQFVGYSFVFFLLTFLFCGAVLLLFNRWGLIVGPLVIHFLMRLGFSVEY